MSTTTKKDAPKADASKGDTQKAEAKQPKPQAEPAFPGKSGYVVMAIDEDGSLSILGDVVNGTTYTEAAEAAVKKHKVASDKALFVINTRFISRYVSA